MNALKDTLFRIPGAVTTLSFIFIVGLLLAPSNSCAQAPDNDFDMSYEYDADSICADSDDFIYEYVDEMPSYPGGLHGLMSFIGNNLKYPNTEADVQGRVIVAFVVNKDGSVSDIKIKKSLHPDFDAEAIRVVSMLDGFTPALKNGRPVNVWFLLPISFKLHV